MLSVGCSDDFAETGIPAQPGTLINFGAQQETLPNGDTRTAYGTAVDGFLPINWCAGDEVMLFSPQAQDSTVAFGHVQQAPYTIQQGGGMLSTLQASGSKSLYWGDEPTHDFYGYYGPQVEEPFRFVNDAVEQYGLIPAHQSINTTDGVYEYCNMDYAVMLANAQDCPRVATPITIPFIPQFTVVEVSISGASGHILYDGDRITSIDVESLDGTPIAGCFKMTGNVIDTTAMEYASDIVSVKLGEEGVLLTTGNMLKVTAFLLPTTTENIRVVINRELKKKQEDEYVYLDGGAYKDVTIVKRAYNRITLGDMPSITDNREFVDLGLPSGLEWASCNIGALLPTEVGDYFGWGEITPHGKVTLDENHQSTFEGHSARPEEDNDGYWYTADKYDFGSSSAYTKYNNTDKKTVLDIEDDAARANWGGNWRMPTAEEWDELVSYTTMTSVTDGNGKAIYHTFTANDGSGNYIIVPATGPWYDNEDPYRTEANPKGGNQTWYWLPNLSGTNSTTPYVECIHVGGDRHQKTTPLRYYGLPIRAVRNTEIIHDFVDLGLPSGIKWATTNVGANEPAAPGDYYAWGETETKASYNSFVDKNTPVYAWSDASGNMTKYNPAVDELTQLERADDAASKIWRSTWQTPTQADWQELVDYCDWTWTSQTYSTLNNKNQLVDVTMNGYEVRGRGDYTDCSIFIPAAGYYSNKAQNSGTAGCYWTQELDTTTPTKAFYMNFTNGSKTVGSYFRYYGLPIRPICR